MLDMIKVNKNQRIFAFKNQFHINKINKFEILAFKPNGLWFAFGKSWLE
jgi:hypothetical protein